MSNNREINPVLIFDLIPQEKIQGKKTPDCFKNFPMYTIVGNGILKENMGIKKNPEDIIVYDVSNASKEFREEYASDIVKFRAKGVTRSGQQPVQQVTNQPWKEIRTMLSLLGEYTKLSGVEQVKLGHNFVTIDALEGGLRISPLLSIKYELPGNTYLEIDPSTFDRELYEKLSNEMTELIRLDNGLYEKKCTLEQRKEL